MSCNLDHVLYDLQNATQEEKSQQALDFAERYMDKLDEFRDFIRESEFSKCDGYQLSWAFIKEDNHSLQRYSNLGICFS